MLQKCSVQNSHATRRIDMSNNILLSTVGARSTASKWGLVYHMLLVFASAMFLDGLDFESIHRIP